MEAGRGSETHGHVRFRCVLDAFGAILSRPFRYCAPHTTSLAVARPGCMSHYFCYSLDNTLHFIALILCHCVLQGCYNVSSLLLCHFARSVFGCDDDAQQMLLRSRLTKSIATGPSHGSRTSKWSGSF